MLAGLSIARGAEGGDGDLVEVGQERISPRPYRRLPPFTNRGSGGAEHTLPQEIEACPPVTLAFEQLELVHEALGRSVWMR